jgi:hypothetical protein
MDTEQIAFNTLGTWVPEAPWVFAQNLCPGDLEWRADAHVSFRGYQEAMRSDGLTNFPLTPAKKLFACNSTFLKPGRTLAVTGWSKIIPVR